MKVKELYKSKLMSAEEAVKLIPDRITLGLGMAASEPRGLLEALEQRVKAGVYSDLKLRYLHSEAPLHDTLLKFEYMDIIKPYPFFVGPIERDIVKQSEVDQKKRIFYVPANFSMVPRLMREAQIDAFILTVSPMGKSGLMSCGTNGDYTIATAREAKRLIVEVNPNMPRTFGDSCLHVSEVSAIIENDCPLVEIPARPATELDHQISRSIVEMVPDRACLQFGVGGVPNAVCAALKDHKDLGVHSELMGPGLVELIRSGAVTNRYKQIHRYKNVYTVAMGDKAMYDYLNNNSSMETYSVEHVNNPYVIGTNDNVVSINAFIEIDLSGQVNAEFMKGHQFSAPGGQLDFVRGAAYSKGGKSILTAYSTAAKDTVSRIVPRIEGAVTDPRADVDCIVTEYGVAHLRGRSTTERTEALISIAHPKFRKELTEQAKAMHYL